MAVGFQTVGLPKIYFDSFKDPLTDDVFYFVICLVWIDSGRVVAYANRIEILEQSHYDGWIFLLGLGWRKSIVHLLWNGKASKEGFNVVLSIVANHLFERTICDCHSFRGCCWKSERRLCGDMLVGRVHLDVRVLFTSFYQTYF